MENKKIILISAVMSLTGIILLMTLMLVEEPEKLKIERLNQEILNKKVSVFGEVVKIRNYSEFQIITISDLTGKIDVFSEKTPPLKIGQKIKVDGKVEEYENRVQIRSIKICSLTLKLS